MGEIGTTLYEARWWIFSLAFGTLWVLWVTYRLVGPQRRNGR
jgi:hypothetical protein